MLVGIFSGDPLLALLSLDLLLILERNVLNLIKHSL